MPNTKPPLLVHRLLMVMATATTSLQMMFPVLTLLFFDTQSRLFLESVPVATRSLWYGMCIATLQIGTLAAAPLLSGLSDYIGRKKILALATLSTVTAALTIGAGAFFGILSLVFIGCVIQGSFSNLKPTAQAVIGEVAPLEKKIIYMGYLQLAISVGAFIGPVLGGYFAKGAWFNLMNFSLPYFIAVLFAFTSFFLTVFFFQETLSKKENIFGTLSRKQLFQSVIEIIKMKNVIAISWLLFLCQISWSLYYQFIPPLLKNTLHYSSGQIGLFVGMIAFWLGLATFFGIKFITRFLPIKKIITVSLTMLFSGLLLTALSSLYPDNLGWLLWLAAIPTAVGDVVAYSCFITLYSHCVASNQQGKVMGLCFIIISLTWTMTGLVGGILSALDPINPIVASPLGALIFLVCYRKIAKAIREQ